MVPATAFTAQLSLQPLHHAHLARTPPPRPSLLSSFPATGPLRRLPSPRIGLYHSSASAGSRQGGPSMVVSAGGSEGVLGGRSGGLAWRAARGAVAYVAILGYQVTPSLLANTRHACLEPEREHEIVQPSCLVLPRWNHPWESLQVTDIALRAPLSFSPDPPWICKKKTASSLTP